MATPTCHHQLQGVAGLWPQSGEHLDMSAADVNPFILWCQVLNGKNGHRPTWNLVIYRLCVSLFKQHKYQILKPSMAEDVNIASRKRRRLCLDPEDGFRKLACKERMNWYELEQGDCCLDCRTGDSECRGAFLEQAFCAPPYQSCILSVHCLTPSRHLVLSVKYTHAWIWGNFNKPFSRMTILGPKYGKVVLSIKLSHLTWCFQL